MLYTDKPASLSEVNKTTKAPTLEERVRATRQSVQHCLGLLDNLSGNVSAAPNQAQEPAGLCHLATDTQAAAADLAMRMEDLVNLIGHL